jgi:hypothetical protein
VLRWLVLGLLLVPLAGCVEGQKPTSLRQKAPIGQPADTGPKRD